MGNLFQKFLSKMSVTDEDDLDDMEDYDSEISSSKEMRRSTLRSTEKDFEPKTVSRTEEEDFPPYNAERRERVARVEKPVQQQRVIPLRSQTAANRSLEVSIMRPKRFDDATFICDMLVNERATVVNLEGIDGVMAQRIMDFVCGAVYSLNGKIHQISGLIFIISPENVDISGDYLSYIEQDGFEVPTISPQR